MKLRNKLILSCAALAAVATTAFSTTFAWYTSNTVVQAGNVTATSANSGSELLLIADGKKATTTGSGTSAVTTITNITGTDLKWGTEVNNVVETVGEMTPLLYMAKSAGETDTSTGVLATLETTTVSGVKTDGNPATAPASDSAGYVEFRLFFKNASTTAKALNFTLNSFTNSDAAALPTKTIVGDNAKFIGLASSAGEYNVDAARALCLDMEIYTSTDAGANTTFVSENVYRFEDASNKVTIATDSLASKTAATDAITVSAGEDGSYSAGSTYSAHQYRNAIMDNQLSGITDPTSYATTQMNAAGELDAIVPAATFATAGTSATKNNCVLIVGRIFLNGWDLACFDACQGQHFTMSFTFDVES